jgi:hypothetical protein
MKTHLFPAHTCTYLLPHSSAPVMSFDNRYLYNNKDERDKKGNESKKEKTKLLPGNPSLNPEQRFIFLYLLSAS